MPAAVLEQPRREANNGCEGMVPQTERQARLRLAGQRPGDWKGERGAKVIGDAALSDEEGWQIVGKLRG